MLIFQFLRKKNFRLEKSFFLPKKCIYFISYRNEHPVYIYIYICVIYTICISVLGNRYLFLPAPGSRLSDLASSRYTGSGSLYIFCRVRLRLHPKRAGPKLLISSFQGLLPAPASSKKIRHSLPSSRLQLPKPDINFKLKIWSLKTFFLLHQSLPLLR